MWEPMPFGRAYNCNFVAHRLNHFQGIAAHRTEMEQQVEHREFNLPKEGKRGLKNAAP